MPVKAFDSGHDLVVRESETCIRLSAVSTKPTSDPLSSSFSPHPQKYLNIKKKKMCCMDYGDGCTTMWMHLMPVNLVNFMLCVATDGRNWCKSLRAFQVWLTQAVLGSPLLFFPVYMLCFLPHLACTIQCASYPRFAQISSNKILPIYDIHVHTLSIGRPHLTILPCSTWFAFSIHLEHIALCLDQHFPSLVVYQNHLES